MRKIVVTEFLSLDGVFEAPGPDGSEFKYEGWTFAYHDDEAMKFKNDELMAADVQLLGRITYDGFARAWPKMDGTGEFGEKMNGMRKYVVSKTLKKADWENSQIINDNIAEEIKKLKEEEGTGDILVAGSGQLVRFLMEHNLVDQFNLLVYPVVLGEGKRLFDSVKKSDLQLVKSKPFSSGVVLLQYQPKK